MQPLFQRTSSFTFNQLIAGRLQLAGRLAAQITGAGSTTQQQQAAKIGVDHTRRW